MRAGQSEHCVRSRAPAIFLSPPARMSARLLLDAACCGSMRVCARGFCDAASAFGEGPRPSELTHCVYSHCDAFALGACRALKRRTMRIRTSHSPCGLLGLSASVRMEALWCGKCIRQGLRPSEPVRCVYSQCNTFALGACRALKRRTVRIVLEVFAFSEIRMHGHCVVRRASAFAQISHT